jgi:hypothetical protein
MHPGAFGCRYLDLRSTHFCSAGILPALLTVRLAQSSQAQRGISLRAAKTASRLSSLLLFFLLAGFAESLMLFPVGLFVAALARLQKQFDAVQDDRFRSQDFLIARHICWVDCNSLSLSFDFFGIAIAVTITKSLNSYSSTRVPLYGHGKVKSSDT